MWILSLVLLNFCYNLKCLVFMHSSSILTKERRSNVKSHTINPTLVVFLSTKNFYPTFPSLRSFLLNLKAGIVLRFSSSLSLALSLSLYKMYSVSHFRHFRIDTFFSFLSTWSLETTGWKEKWIESAVFSFPVQGDGCTKGKFKREKARKDIN